MAKMKPAGGKKLKPGTGAGGGGKKGGKAKAGC